MASKNSFKVKPIIATEQIAATPTPLENPSTPASSFPNESRVFSKSHDDFRIEQIKKLKILYHRTTLCYQKVCGRLSLRKRYTQ